jgi:hypothetical protein
MRIGLFVPCYTDAFFPEVGIATLELLERMPRNTPGRDSAGSTAASAPLPGLLSER